MYSKAMKARDTNHRTIITNIFPFQAKAHGSPRALLLYLEKMRNREKKLDLFRRAWYYRNTCRGLFFMPCRRKPRKGRQFI